MYTMILSKKVFCIVREKNCVDGLQMYYMDLHLHDFLL